MTFDDILAQIRALLQREGRVSYRALKRRFDLDDDYLEDVKDELIYAKHLAVDEDNRVLVWAGEQASASAQSPAPDTPDLASAPATDLEHDPLSYTPSYLAEKILTSRSALEGERKQVTVLFADLKGSMELLADRDPEEARQLLDPVLERMLAAVHRYEGTVNQIMGDGIMALFGAPIAHEDHAVRACYAALAMQATVQQYAAEVQRTKGVPLQMRVGVNAGEVVVRTIGNDLRMDYSAVGQTTHLAARMEQMAMPGSILMTPAVLRLTEGYIQIKPLGLVPVKGLSAPVEVFELVGASGIRRRLQATVARGLTRFVGRQSEFETLRQALERAGTGQGQVVATVGEPGVGKSRLVYEFVHSHHTPGWLVLESASVSYGRATPYFPVIDLLKRYSHVEEHDDARTIRAKVTGQILTLDETLQETIPALLSLLDALPEDSPFVKLGPPQRRQRTLDALKRVVLRESQEQPLVLIFEDLHWIDSETQALLENLVESLPTARMLLLVNYRPEYQHGWGSKTYYTQLRLDPLAPASAEEVLQALLGDDPSLTPLTQLLITRTEGNPFFLEESVRTLVETEVLVGAAGAYGLMQALPTIQVPATVQAVLAARIDRLLPEEKRLLQTAAVIGTDAPYALLRAIVDVPAAALHRGLAHLQAAEFLYETRLFPEPEYTFKHALTHEVAYNSLLLERRRVLHGRIVEALEGLAGERVAEQVERLAHHAVRGEVWDKAVTYCQQAGARAYERAAFREAVTAFERALQALAHLPDLGDTSVLAIELRLAVERPLRALGQYGQCRARLGEAEALARVLDDRARLGWVLAGIANVLRIMGDPDSALVAGQEAHALALERGDRSLQEQVARNLGVVYYAIGDFMRAAELLRWNVEAPEREASSASTDVRIQSQAWLARTLHEMGAFAEGRRHGEEALRRATLAGRGIEPIVAYGCLGHVYLGQGDLDHAVRVLDQGLTLCRASGNRDFLRPIMVGLGFAYTLQGRLAEGRALLEEGVSETLRTGGRLNPFFVTCLSEACRLAGGWDEAWRYACQALDAARPQKNRAGEALALHQLGVVYAHADSPDVAQAEAHYQQALVLAEELGMRPLQAHCHRGLGTWYATIGQQEQARTELAMALEMYRSMAMTFWLPQTEAALAQVEER